jgi:FAD/FMN-containing dehydrogenase
MEHNQTLPLDPLGSGATIGGVIAANAYGPSGTPTAPCATGSSA